MDKFKAPQLLIRIGLAFVFAYAAISSLNDPAAGAGFFPRFFTAVVSEKFLLTSFSVMQLFLAAWLVWGKWSFYSASISALMLLGIVVANIGAMLIVFRDIGLFFAAAALAVMSRNEDRF